VDAAIDNRDFHVKWELYRTGTGGIGSIPDNPYKLSLIFNLIWSIRTISAIFYSVVLCGFAFGQTTRKDSEMLSWLRRFREDEQGQSLVEYTLLLAFILFVVIGLTGGYHNSVAGIASVSNSQLAAANTYVQ